MEAKRHPGLLWLMLLLLQATRSSPRAVALTARLPVGITSCTSSLYSGNCCLRRCLRRVRHLHSRLCSCIQGICTTLVLFAEYMSGWLCFVVSILWIAILTGIIGDLASALGCTIKLKDSVTAISFVALGTSVPGQWLTQPCGSYLPLSPIYTHWQEMQSRWMISY